jgi:hypothetical protein
MDTDMVMAEGSSTTWWYMSREIIIVIGIMTIIGMDLGEGIVTTGEAAAKTEAMVMAKTEVMAMAKAMVREEETKLPLKIEYL